MTRNTIMVDIDDTLYDFKGCLIPVIARVLGISVERAKMTSWASLWIMLGESQANMDAVFTVCYRAETIARNRAYEGAAAGLTALAAVGFQIVYVTDRYEWAHAATTKWLEREGFPGHENLVCTADKRGWITENADQLFAVVDDRPRTMDHAKCAGVPSVLSLEQEWNTAMEDVAGITLAASWRDITHYIANATDSLPARIAALA